MSDCFSTIQDIKFNYFHGAPNRTIEIIDQVVHFCDADLMFVLNDHDFINIKSDKLARLFQSSRLMNNIICLREAKSKVRQYSKIPEILINGKWYNCGGEEFNPIVFQPRIVLAGRPHVVPIVSQENNYIRFETKLRKLALGTVLTSLKIPF